MEQQTSGDHAKPLSQELMLNEVLNHLKAEGKVFQKTSHVCAARREDDEPIPVETVINSVVETCNWFRKGDWIVQNVGGEQYVLKDAVFQERYQVDNAETTDQKDNFITSWY